MFNFDDLIRDSDIPKDEHGIPIISDDMSIATPAVSNKEILVHATDFFPRNKTIYSWYDTKSEGNGIVGYSREGSSVLKECRARIHRHTVHFAINTKVESHSFGNWDQCKYIILEPLENHPNDFFDGHDSDFFSTSSLSLSDDAILMVRDDCFDSLSPEDLHGIHVVKYHGNDSECCKNLLRCMGVAPREWISDAGHMMSKYMKLEVTLGRRDEMINFYKDNTFFDDGNADFSAKDIMCLYDIYSHATTKISVLDDRNSLCHFYRFLAAFGITKKSDGHFGLKNDETMFEEIKDNGLISIQNLQAISSDILCYYRDKIVKESIKDSNHPKLSDICAMYVNYLNEDIPVHVLDESFFSNSSLPSGIPKTFYHFIADMGLSTSVKPGFPFSFLDSKDICDSMENNENVSLENINRLYLGYQIGSKNFSGVSAKEEDTISLSDYTLGDLFYYKNLKPCMKFFSQEFLLAKEGIVNTPVITEDGLKVKISSEMATKEIQLSKDMPANLAASQLKEKIPKIIYDVTSTAQELNQMISGNNTTLLGNSVKK